MKKITFLLILFTSFSIGTKLNAACVWKTKISNFSLWDTCQYGGGQVTVNNTSCLYYKWTINGSTYVQGPGGSYSSFSFPITANGTYSICVKISDTCNKCDTTLCSSFTISCFKSCNWKGKLAYVIMADTCRGYNKKNSINGEVVFSTGTNTSCFKYQWIINGVVKGTGVKFAYNVTQNGTYSQYVKITDTCKKCDTLLYRGTTVTFSCISNCNWKGRKPSMLAYDSCNTWVNQIYAGISFNGSYSGTYKYYWTLNGSPVSYGSSGVTLSVTSNGTYSLCVKVTDTINQCDTTFCKQVTVSCIKNCNWKSRSPYVYFNDTCNGSGKRNKINAGISIGSGTCYKYLWTVNGSPVGTNTGYPHWLVYDITKNGTYNVCVKVTDTCNKCDTTFCSTKTFTCFTSCMWPSKVSNVYMSDTCRGYGQKNTINGNVIFKNNTNTSCFKYQWSINGVVQGTGTQFTYNVPQNGTYYQCLRIKDTCNNCDTLICRYVTISCINKPCGWKTSVKLNVNNKCYNNSDTLYAYVTSNSSNSCPRYVWTLNGVNQYAPYSSVFSMPITQNGSYTLCVKVLDSCNNCDTTLCSTFAVSCLKSNICNNWKGRLPFFYVRDTCTGKSSGSLYGAMNFSTSGCFKNKWFVNNKMVSMANTLNYNITTNGLYYVCVNVRDTCNNCDTTFCVSKIISCINACNFKSGGSSFSTYDTCAGNKSRLGGSIYFSNKPCLKYLWTVGGVGVSNAAYFNTNVYNNGSYKICVKVMDTCNNCDTTYCVTRTVNCSGLGLFGRSRLEAGIKLYPNPANQLLNIERDGSTCPFEITDIVGSSVYKGELKEGNNTVLTETWPSGVYLLKITEENGVHTVKIIVSR